MKLNRWGINAAIVWMSVVSHAAIAQNAPIAQLNTYFDQAREAGLLNGNILIADHSKIVLARAVGYADASRTVPLTMSDRFDIGSIAKEFDAVGLLLLVQEGKLSLTDPVSKFIPDLPAWAAEVTMNDLLHYTSGLPDVDWNTVHNDADAFRNLRALKQLDNPVGTHYAYNNNNTFLRRRVIEQISGMSFGDFLRKRVFPKAGILDAVIDPTDATPRVAKDFDAQFKQDPLTVDMTGWTALTVEDFLRWSNCIADFCLITPNSTRQIVTTQNPKWQTGLGHGEMIGNRLVHHLHDGNDHDFEALLVADPPKGRTIILVTSQNRNHVYAMAHAIDAILDGKPFVPLSAAK